MHVACIHTYLISGPSAVSLVPRPEDRLLSSSLRSFSGPPCFLLCPGLTQPVLCCFNFEAPPLFARVTSRTRLCYIDDRPPKLHFENFNIDYPLDLLCCEKCVFSNFHNATIVIQRIQNLRYDVRIHIHIHTYIHTYRQTPLAFNTLMWGSLRLAPIKDFIFTDSWCNGHVLCQSPKREDS